MSFEHEITSYCDDNQKVIEIITPNASSRLPNKISCVVDISGSMGGSSAFGDKEDIGLSYLDLVIHLLRTIINNMEDGDYFSLVTYNHLVSDVLDNQGLIQITESSRNMIDQKISRLRPNGRTNIWGGLLKGMEILNSKKEIPGISNCILLTDGVPNVLPPRSHKEMITNYIEKNGNNILVHTIGLGYNIQSDVLQTLLS